MNNSEGVKFDEFKEFDNECLKCSNVLSKNYCQDVIECLDSFTRRELYVLNDNSGYTMEEGLDSYIDNNTKEKVYYKDVRPEKKVVIINKLRCDLMLADGKEITILRTYKYKNYHCDALLTFKVFRNNRMYTFLYLVLIDKDEEFAKNILSELKKEKLKIIPGVMLINKEKIENNFSEDDDIVVLDYKMKNLRIIIKEQIDKNTV